jgi:hypothetical protein
MATVYAIKEQAVTAAPLLLAVVTLSNGTVFRWSTHPLASSEGGYAPSISGWAHTGQDFQGRLSNQSLEEIQSMSPQGIDQIPSVSLEVADPDGAIFRAVERTGPKFKGASVELFLVTCDFTTDPWTWSDNVVAKFRGLAEKPGFDGRTITLSCQAAANLQKKSIPFVIIQPRCNWLNPTTTAARAIADQEDSAYYECGETRDLATAPHCSYTEETCTRPLRFSGFTFRPPDSWRGKSYLDKKIVEGRNAASSAYGKPIPMVYGSAWLTDAPVVVISGDPNSTRMIVALTVGNLGGSLGSAGSPGRVRRVIVNDTEVPFVAYSPDKSIFRWEWSSLGTRDGNKITDAGFDGLGNPYGSIATIEIVVYKSVAASDSVPRVQVLMDGPDIRAYSAPNTFTLAPSDNFAWVIADLLTWCGIKYAELDVASFIAAAGICSPTITFTDASGATRAHERFACSLAISDITSAAEIVQGLLRACRGNLTQSPSNGKWRLRLRGTMASQQPAAITGSNNSTPITSKALNGSVANGYSAYDFTSASIGRKEGFSAGDRPLSLRELPQQSSDAPNRLTLELNDRYNSYLRTPARVTDADDVQASGQEIEASLNLKGIASFEHGARVTRSIIREQQAPVIEFETSQRAAHLQTGDIVRVTDATLGFTLTPFRIRTIRPAADSRRHRIIAHEHNDDWYLDTFGQQRDSAKFAGSGEQVDRLPWPWRPNFSVPISGDPITPNSERGFGAAQSYDELNAEGNVVATLRILGGEPPLAASSLLPPVVESQASIGTGGSIPVGQYLFGIAAVDASGAIGPQAFALATATSGSASVSFSVIQWPQGATGYRVFVYDRFVAPSWQQTGSGTPSTITVNGPLTVARYAPPDPLARRLRIYLHRVQHGGVFGAGCSAVAANTITIAGAGWTAGEWIGYDITRVAKEDGSDGPQCSFRVTGNTTDTLTVTPDPDGILSADDVLVMRSKWTRTGRTVTDPKWINGLSGGAGLADISGLLQVWISGPAKGDTYRIASNTSTSMTIDEDYRTDPAGGHYIIIDPAKLGSDLLYDLRAGAEVDARIEVSNYRGQVLLVRAAVQAEDARESIEQLALTREVYVLGRTPDVREVTAAGAASVFDKTLLLNLGSSGDVTLPSPALFQGRPLIVKRTGGATPTLKVAGGGTIDGDTAVPLASDEARVLVADQTVEGGWITAATNQGGVSAGGGDAVVAVSASSGTLTLNHGAGTVFIVTASGDFTLAAPSGLIDDKRLTLKLLGDATGGRTVTLASWWGDMPNLGAGREVTLGVGQIYVAQFVVSAGAAELLGHMDIG